MKIKEMEAICKEQKGCCYSTRTGKVCPLWMEDRWTISEPCLLALRKLYTNEYLMHKARGNYEKAQECLDKYAKIEKKYLGHKTEEVSG